MAKRKVTFEDLEEEGGEGPRPPRKRAAALPVGGPGSRFSGKPSLDSDEEDEEEEEEAEGWGSDARQLEGQEAGPAAEGEGPVPLTPFNLEEELGEGSFHPWGGFVPRRKPRPPDPWLEAVDWSQVRARPPRPAPEGVASAGGVASRPPSPPPLPELLRAARELLRPGETVGGALRRLGGGPRARARRGRGSEAPPPAPPPPPELETLCGLADALLARGLLGALGETRERLGRRLRVLGGGASPPGTPPRGHAPGEDGHAPREDDEPTPGEDGLAPEEGGHAPEEGGHAPWEDGHAPEGGGHALDMFAPDEEEEKKEEEEGEGPEEVLWELRWEHGGDGGVHGPFSSAQMQEWAEQGYFRGGGARCRRVRPPGPFYDCARLDFELYT